MENMSVRLSEMERKALGTQDELERGEDWSLWSKLTLKSCHVDGVFQLDGEGWDFVLSVADDLEENQDGRG